MSCYLLFIYLFLFCCARVPLIVCVVAISMSPHGAAFQIHLVCQAACAFVLLFSFVSMLFRWFCMFVFVLCVLVSLTYYVVLCVVVALLCDRCLSCVFSLLS